MVLTTVIMIVNYDHKTFIVQATEWAKMPYFIKVLNLILQTWSKTILDEFFYIYFNLSNIFSSIITKTAHA